MRFACVVLSPLLLFAGLAAPARAAHATVEVAADHASVAPGGRVTVAFAFTIRPEWHLYWVNPGGTGLPPRIKWTAPKGTAIGTPQFPLPKRIEAGGVTAFGYEKEVAVLVDMMAPEDAKDALTLKADVKWVVCGDACVAEAQSVTITLPVGEDRPVAAERFAAWRAAQPARTPPQYIAATVGPGAKTGTLDVPLPPGASGVEFFPPKFDFADFGPATTAGGTYRLPFRILPDAPSDYQAVGIVVTRDEKTGTTASREISFSYKTTTP